MIIDILIPVIAIFAAFLIIKAATTNCKLARDGISAKYRSSLLVISILGALTSLVIAYFAFHVFALSFGSIWLILLVFFLGFMIGWFLWKSWQKIFEEGCKRQNRILRIIDLMKCKVWVLAKEYLEDEINSDANNILAYYYLISLHFFQHNWQEVIVIVNKGLDIYWVSKFWKAMLYYVKAHSLIMQYADYEAVQILKQALKYGKKDSEFPTLDVKEKIAQLSNGQGNRIRCAIEEGAGIHFVECKQK